MKKFVVTIVFILLLSLTAMAQWTYQGPWPDTTYKGGSHGFVVTPDGNIWQASYYRSSWVTPSNDTIQCTPIFVFSPDGTLLDQIGIVSAGGVTDTLGYESSTSGTRGMSKDFDGNILWTQGGPSKLIKINYQTREAMAIHRFVTGQIGSSPTKPAASSDGSIFVGPVVGNNNPDAKIAIFSSDLTYLGTAVEGPPAIARTMEVSADGLTIYWTVFTGVHLGIFIYERLDEFSPFELKDSVLQGMAIETAAWNPATGHLWVSNDSRGTGPYTHLTWYAMDVTTKALVDSFTFTPPTPGLTDEFPRALGFSNNGSNVYIGLFGSAFDRIFKFEGLTSVEDPGYTVVNGYKLSQNYPNPFNPSTKISFELPSSGFVTLKVYDMLGREVATLVNNEMTSGSHTVNFNAADLSSGTYVYQLSSNGNLLTNKMVLLK